MPFLGRQGGKGGQAGVVGARERISIYLLFYGLNVEGGYLSLLDDAFVCSDIPIGAAVGY